MPERYATPLAIAAAQLNRNGRYGCAPSGKVPSWCTSDQSRQGVLVGIERYRRRESSVEEALIELYLAGVLGAPRGRYHRSFVGHSLNALLEAEADRLCNAQRYERSEARRDTRAGHYERAFGQG